MTSKMTNLERIRIILTLMDMEVHQYMIRSLIIETSEELQSMSHPQMRRSKGRKANIRESTLRTLSQTSITSQRKRTALTSSRRIRPSNITFHAWLWLGLVLLNLWERCHRAQFIQQDRKLIIEWKFLSHSLIQCLTESLWWHRKGSQTVVYPSINNSQGHLRNERGPRSDL